MVDVRLKAIADLIEMGNESSSNLNRVVCDVGTDHAYLPCYLVKSGIVSRCIACDINEKPLEQAKNHIALYGLQDKIDTALSDGLKDIPPSMADNISDIVVAGMGGELIGSIITGVEYTKNPHIRFILQPMSNASYLREFLYSHGFFIVEERAVIDKHHYYTVMLVQYSGEIVITDSVFNLVGMLTKQNTSEAERYIKHEHEKLIKISQGMKASKSASDELARVEQLCEKLGKQY